MKIKNIKTGERLDKFLTEELNDKTRSQIQKDIEKGLVLVNGEEKRSHYKLKDEDIVEVNKEQRTKNKEQIARNKEQKKQRTKKKFKKFKLVFDGDDFLIVNKPSGLIVHGAEHIDEETLVDQLLIKYPKLKGVGEGEERPGIVHRLDKDASGIMIIAKTNKSFKSLKKQFQDREIEKEYTALVFGQIEKDEDRIDFPIKRAVSGNRQAAVPESFRDRRAQTREAITVFDVVKRFVNYTFLKVGIKTGRKHQIRVHMSAYGHPIVGDSLYCTKKTKELNKKLDFGRIFLVATKFAFRDLKGERREFEIDLPNKLKEFLKIQR